MLYRVKHLGSIISHFGVHKNNILKSSKKVLKWDSAIFLKGYRLSNFLAKLSILERDFILVPFFFLTIFIRPKIKEHREYGEICYYSQYPLASVFSDLLCCKPFLRATNFLLFPWNLQKCSLEGFFLLEVLKSLLLLQSDSEVYTVWWGLLD